MINRRKILSSFALTPLLGAGLVNPASAQQRPGSATTLVAWFSRTGNTRVVADYVRRAVGADTFEIVTAEAYPEDYDATVAQAREETASGYRPPLRDLVASAAQYDTIYLAFPIWGTTMPPPVRSFLATHDLAGKSIVPLITHGGYGVGSSLTVLADDAPAAAIASPFVLEADQERQTIDALSSWLATPAG